MQPTEVITHNQRSDLVDPLVDYSALSFFKQSLNLSSSSSALNSSVFDSMQTHTKARVLSSPHKVFKQTSAILEDNLDASKADKTQPAFTENEKAPRERRPALGLKRTKFSVKPMPSQSAMNVEPSIDFDKITDPDELFTAFERMENAKKEVQRLRGEPLVDLDLNTVSLAPRRRRPSLLGRSATYTHRSYPSVSTAAVDETLLSSQEKTNIEMFSPSRSDIVPDATLETKSSSMRLPDSKATTTSKVSKLDELLSSNYEGLDEDGVQNLLRDKLQIKSVDIGKALLPDWRVPLRESLTSSLALPKMDETVFHLHGANKTVSSKDIKKSSAKPSSPLASISVLNKHIGKQTSPSTNLFSSHHFDTSPTKSSDPSRESGKGVDHAGQSEEFDATKDLFKFRSPTHGEDVLVSGETPIVSVAEDIHPTNDTQEKEGVLGNSDDIDAMKNMSKFRRSPAHVEEDMVVSGEPSFDSVAKDINPTPKPQEKEVVVGNSDQNSARTGSCELERSPAHGKLDTAVSGDVPFCSVEKDVDQTSEPKVNETMLGKSDQADTRSNSCEAGRSFGHEERTAVSDVGLSVEPEKRENEVAASRESIQQELIIEGLMENPSSNGGGISKPFNTENNPGEELFKEKVGRPKRKLKEKMKPKTASEAAVSERTQAATSQLDVPVSKETRTKRRKVEGAQPRPSKKEKRFSLYYAGTKWEDGVRRSTRVRMRPLEYWNGERFLYGRVHDSLVTVIGVRYASPSKEAEETEVKVKSFVSDEYKDLVERVSLY